MQTRALAGSLTPALLSALLLAPQPAPLQASPGSPRAPHPRRPRPTPPPAPLSPQALTRQRGRARPRTRRPPRMPPRSRPSGVAMPRQASPCGHAAPPRALAAAAAGSGRRWSAETSPRSRCARELGNGVLKRALSQEGRPDRGLESCLGSGNQGGLRREVRPTRRGPATLSERRGRRARGMPRGSRVRALMCRVLLSHCPYHAHHAAE